jgi:anti-sigma factor RsiW
LSTKNTPCRIPLDRLADYVRGRLSATQQAEVQSHLSLGCDRCVGDVLADPRSVEPTEAVIQRALKVFPRPAPTPPLRERIRALLVFDSLNAPAALGVRTASLYGRQYLYRSNTVDINLHVQPQDSPYVALIGQVMPGSDVSEAMAGLRVQLTVGNSVQAESATNEVGEFIFSHLRQGLYDFAINLKDHDLVIEGLQV